MNRPRLSHSHSGSGTRPLCAQPKRASISLCGCQVSSPSITTWKERPSAAGCSSTSRFRATVTPPQELSSAGSPVGTPRLIRRETRSSYGSSVRALRPAGLAQSRRTVSARYEVRASLAMATAWNPTAVLVQSRHALPGLQNSSPGAVPPGEPVSLKSGTGSRWT